MRAPGAAAATAVAVLSLMAIPAAPGVPAFTCSACNKLVGQLPKSSFALGRAGFSHHEGPHSTPYPHQILGAATRPPSRVSSAAQPQLPAETFAYACGAASEPSRGAGQSRRQRSARAPRSEPSSAQLRPRRPREPLLSVDAGKPARRLRDAGPRLARGRGPRQFCEPGRLAPCLLYTSPSPRDS